jgi:hypothetical protein
VQHAPGQRVTLLVDPSSRLDGGEGVTRLAQVLEGESAPQLAESIFGEVKLTRAATYDGCSQVVLPWHSPQEGVIDEVLVDAGKSYKALSELARLGALIPGAATRRTRTVSKEHASKESSIDPEPTVEQPRVLLPEYKKVDIHGSHSARTLLCMRAFF